MLVPISWLKEYVDIDVPLSQFVDDMVMSGSKVETVHKFGGGIEKVVVGKLLDVYPHPDSDHMVICKTDVGGAYGSDPEIMIVTGAPNVKTGDIVPVILDGGLLPGDVRITKGVLRGVESNGMLCAADELGFSDKVNPYKHKEGIWILPAEYEKNLGEDIVTALGLDENVIEFEITPNRPDCLSIIGIAREVAAVYSKGLKYPKLLDPNDKDAGFPEGEAASDYIKVGISKPEYCSRYVARVAKDIVVDESPMWMQLRLMFAGQRPINNIVDITNYVMLEMGHPIHAFDINTVEGRTINVDTAKPGETITTLDGKVHETKESILLIKDAEKGIGVAGIMGGLNSEIEDDTKTILIEAATFDKDNIRFSAKWLGIRSEASARYEKGIPPQLSGDANARVCQLIKDIDAGVVIGGAEDCYPVPPEPVVIPTRVWRMNQVLGTDLKGEEMVGYLKRLELEVDDSRLKDEGIFEVRPIPVRVDLLEEIDMTEEVGRIHGFDKLPLTISRSNVPAEMSKSWSARLKAREVLTGAGIDQIETYSFISPSDIDMAGVSADPIKSNLVKLINPLGEDTSVMRTTLIPGLLKSLRLNDSRSIADCRVFEIGNVFYPTTPGELPNEVITLSIGAYSSDDKISAGLGNKAADFYWLKGVLANLFKKLGIDSVAYIAESEDPTYHSGRAAKVMAAAAGGGEDIYIGTIGEIHPEVTEKFGIERRVIAAELNFDTITELANPIREYTPVPKYPAVLLDIAVLVDEDVPVGDLESLINLRGGKILEQVKLFDVYRGEQVPEGKKSLAFGLTFRDSEKTLTDDDAGKAMTKILHGLKSEFDAILREG